MFVLVSWYIKVWTKWPPLWRHFQIVAFVLSKSTTISFNLTHWGRVTHICVSDLTIIGSDNGLSPGRRQAIIWTNAGLLSIEPLRTYFSENLIKIQPFSLKKMSSAKWRPSCLGLNVLNVNDAHAQSMALIALSTRLSGFLIHYAWKCSSICEWDVWDPFQW